MQRGWAFVKAAATDRVLLGQLIRYGITGGGVTLMGVAVYWLLAKPAHLPEQVANVLSWALCVATGYAIHSSWSFRGHGTRADPWRQRVRFGVAALVGLSLNAFWVWLLVTHLGGPEWWPMPLMACATPLIIFPMNRRWVFA